MPELIAQTNSESALAVSSLTISNHFQEMVQVANWLTEFGTTYQLSNQVLFKLDLVLNEALPNIISYAYLDDNPHQIYLQLQNTENKVWLEIADDGLAFDPLQKIPNTMITTLEDASPTGRGILLIKSFTAEQNYQYLNGLNILRVSIPKA